MQPNSCGKSCRITTWLWAPTAHCASKDFLPSVTMYINWHFHWLGTSMVCTNRFVGYSCLDSFESLASQSFCKNTWTLHTWARLGAFKPSHYRAFAGHVVALDFSSALQIFTVCLLVEGLEDSCLGFLNKLCLCGTINICLLGWCL